MSYASYLEDIEAAREDNRHLFSRPTYPCAPRPAANLKPGGSGPSAALQLFDPQQDAVDNATSRGRGW